MNLKFYKNELFVFLSFLLMFGSYFYKESKNINFENEQYIVTQSISNLKNVISLQNLWANKKISKKLSKLKKSLPSKKMHWSQKNKKIIVKFSHLTSYEVNKVISKFLSIALQLQELKISQKNQEYQVEFVCKW
jgi:hypothetical protein